MTDYTDKKASLLPNALNILLNKATEPPHSGQYNVLQEFGTYLCRRCGLALFRADSQFTSRCGWPSFDEDIQGAVRETKDPDGLRTEILCTRCGSHLGHVFIGEHFTAKNKRYCVNSASIDFVSETKVRDTNEAILAGGCFWGVEYYLQAMPGVLKVESGYTGGHTLNPSYEEVSAGNTGHYEAVRVLFDVEKLDYYAVVRRFFEIHDPTQRNGQGPDIGSQYQSAIFYYNQTQEEDVKSLVQKLKAKGLDVVTRLLPAQPFWPAEDYHQNYYQKHNKNPYCHREVKRFD
ncbi:bifunctional methionine sulfoxide reductase B/A protein [Legionella impletisoli]|uniref:Peptide methionine sulfoxide reductase MsrA n=1 Tax=Legionella impletisoli TaxID=343510 RepID=A0A917NBM4_9GAMM|nr:bifunctional methionine sulfoxide reductase B/A protein [Legionella impletisoli]GGI84908.1 peptide methionine sulfoxide reductase MsrA [Legionella impletisoli]